MIRNKLARAAILMQVTEFTIDSLLKQYPQLTRKEVVSTIAALIRLRQLDTVDLVRSTRSHTRIAIYKTRLRPTYPKDPEQHLAMRMGSLRYEDFIPCRRSTPLSGAPSFGAPSNS